MLHQGFLRAWCKTSCARLHRESSALIKIVTFWSKRTRAKWYIVFSRSGRTTTALSNRSLAFARSPLEYEIFPRFVRHSKSNGSASRTCNVQTHHMVSEWSHVRSDLCTQSQRESSEHTVHRKKPQIRGSAIHANDGKSYVWLCVHSFCIGSSTQHAWRMHCSNFGARHSDLLPGNRWLLPQNRHGWSAVDVLAGPAPSALSCLLGKACHEYRNPAVCDPLRLGQ